MNDDTLNPSPVGGTSSDTNNPDQHESVADRVFDFSDGDIKRVVETDGPVTASVNKQIEAALRNPMGSVKPGTPSAPTPATQAQSTQPTKPRFDPGPVEDIPQVKVYSQIPHEEKTASPHPVDTKTSQAKPLQSVAQPVPTQSNPQNTFQPTKPGPKINPSLQEILTRVHAASPDRPNIPEEKTLDDKIGSFDATPFARTNSGATPSTAPTPAPTQPSMPIPGDTRATPFQTPSITPPTPPRPSINILERQPIPTNIPVNEQHVVATEKPLPTPPPAPRPTVPPTLQTPKPSAPQEDPFLKPLRTYEGDVADVMSHRRTSVASIAIAETKKNTGEEALATKTEPATSSHAGIKFVMAFLIIMLVAGGVVGGYYLYSKSALAPVVSTPQTPEQTSLIKSNGSVTIPIDGKSSATIRSLIGAEVAKDHNPDTIKEIILTNTGTGAPYRLSAAQAASALNIDMPDILLRSLTADWMLGVYSSPTQDSSIFIVATTNFFQNAFAGMLQWEYVMADDLKEFIQPATPLNNQTSIAQLASTTTATSSIATSTTSSKISPSQTPTVTRGAFKDLIIRNKDVRAFRTESGLTLFVYSFVDNSHLIVARDENVLTALLQRLEKQTFLR